MKTCKRILCLLLLVLLLSGCSRSEYTLYFVTDGGTLIDSVTYQADEFISPPQSPTRNGYRFAGWYTSSKYDQPFVFYKMPAIDTIIYAKWEEVNIETTIKQIEDSQELLVSWKSDELIDKVEISVYHQESLVSSITITDSKAINKGEVNLYAFYGRHNVTIKIYNQDEEIYKSNKDISITTTEYNIAPLSGSMPVTLFSLSINEITNNHQIPTFVWLSRCEAYDWNALPDNVFPFPNATAQEYLTHDNYQAMVEKASLYIQELLYINKESKINLYINDYNIYLYPKFLIANDIDEDRYKVFLLSDGSASYVDFNKAYSNSENPHQTYQEMKTKWDSLKAQIKLAKDYNYSNEFLIDTTTLRQYSYLIASSEKNVEWWLTRTSGTLSAESSFLDEVINHPSVKEKSISKLLEDIQKDEEKTAALKKLYKFSDQMFQESITSNKPAMLILGTKVNLEKDFASYAKAIMSYYGDDFIYYYKGHPGTPTALYPSKQEELKSLNIIDIESSIAAELILFFYSDIYMCGYQSSTFLAVESANQATALFNVTKADASHLAYYPMIEIFISKLDSTSNRSINPLHDNYLMEFQSGETLVFDATDDKLIEIK